MQLKAIRTELKADTDGHFDGYASVFGNRDSYGDVVQPGAFARTIQNDRGRVKVLWQHDPYQPIGIPVEMREDDRGLFVRAKLADTTLGRDALALIKAGVVTELSIGYDSVREEWDNGKSERRLTEIRLWEFSPVTWAANDLARITSVKNASDLDLILDRLERLEWARGRLESDRYRERVSKAIHTLTAIRDGLDPQGAAAPATPPISESAPDAVHATLASISDLKHKVLATGVLHELRSFGETLRRQA